MDSACEDAGPRGSTKACPSELKCAAVTDVGQDKAQCFSVAEVSPPTSPLACQKDPACVPSDRKAPKAGRNRFTTGPRLSPISAGGGFPHQ